MGPGALSAGLGPTIPRARGLPALLLLPRNLILKMVVLSLLCYQWLSRRVVCSAAEVSATAPVPRHPDRALPGEHGAKPGLPSRQGQGSAKQHRRHHLLLCQGEGGRELGRGTPAVGWLGKGVQGRTRSHSPSHPMGAMGRS